MQHYKKAVGSVKKGKKSASGKLRKGAAVARSSVASVKGRRAAAAGKPKLTKTKGAHRQAIRPPDQNKAQQSPRWSCDAGYGPRPGAQELRIRSAS